MQHHKRKIAPEELRELLGRSDPYIVEVGAHDGSDTAQFLQTFPDARIVCFEPDPRPLARLLDRVQGDSRCTVYPYAVSDHAGPATFHQSGGAPPSGWPGVTDWDHSSSLLAPKDHLKVHPWCTFDKTIQVLTTRLDDWYHWEPEAGPLIDLLWMDVQGAEGLVFAGAQKTLQRVRYIYTEFYNREMYAGQLNLSQIQARLPDFEALATYEGYNVLLRRRA